MIINNHVKNKYRNYKISLSFLSTNDIVISGYPRDTQLIQRARIYNTKLHTKVIKETSIVRIVKHLDSGTFRLHLDVVHARHARCSATIILQTPRDIVQPSSKFRCLAATMIKRRGRRLISSKNTQSFPSFFFLSFFSRVAESRASNEYTGC